MINSYISGAGDRILFRNKVGMSAQNAMIEIDNMVYNLATMLPASANAFKHIEKSPRSVEIAERPEMPKASPESEPEMELSDEDLIPEE
jgi:hypothetical protein